MMDILYFDNRTSLEDIKNIVTRIHKEFNRDVLAINKNVFYCEDVPEEELMRIKNFIDLKLLSNRGDAGLCAHCSTCSYQIDPDAEHRYRTYCINCETRME